MSPSYKHIYTDNLKKMKVVGYTLLELVVAVAAIGILGIILTDTFVQSLRGQKKVEIITKVKQTGQSVLDRLSNQLQGAERVVCHFKDGTGYELLTIAKKGTYTRFKFMPAQVTSNGYLAYDNPPVSVELADKSVVLTQPCSEAQVLFNGVTSPINYLTDTNTLTGVSIKKPCPDASDNCNLPIFTKTTVIGGKDAVTIDFKINVGVGVGSSVENLVSEGGIRFNTTIQLR